MKIPKTLQIIECRKCNGSFYAGEHKLVLMPGTVNEFPDEISFMIKKVGRCMSCKDLEDRTLGGKKKRRER